MSATHDADTHRPGRARRRPRDEEAAPPDLGELARTAVVSFLRDASAGAPGEPARGAVEAVADADGALAAQSAAWRAAAVSAAALERIEAAAARVQADIQAALQVQANLQAAAGAAAEAAVRAAQESWEAARSAEAAGTRAQAALRRVEHYVTVTVLLLIAFLVAMAIVTAVSG